MKKVLAVIAVVVGLMTGGAGVANAVVKVTIQLRQLSEGGSAIPGLPPNPCIVGTVAVDNNPDLLVLELAGAVPIDTQVRIPDAVTLSNERSYSGSCVPDPRG